MTESNSQSKFPSISSSQISVVVQGKVVAQTERCLKSVRRCLPEAEIILSTWQGTDVLGLDFDLLVLSDDVSAAVCDFSVGKQNNLNRQLATSRSGVAAASRKYVLKIRSDLVLRSAKFLQYWDAFSARNESAKIFCHRVIVSSIFSRLCSNETGLPLPFHPSDFFLFGLACDLKSYYEKIPFATAEELGNWKFAFADRKPYARESHRYTPEQFLFFHYAKTIFPKIRFDDWTDFSEENIALSNDILFNNFIFLDFRQSGIFCKKFSKQLKNPDSIRGIISFQKFQEEYKARCDSSYNFKSRRLFIIFCMRIRHHARAFALPLKWFLRPAAILYECFKFAFESLLRKNRR